MAEDEAEGYGPEAIAVLRNLFGDVPAHKPREIVVECPGETESRPSVGDMIGIEVWRLGRRARALAAAGDPAAIEAEAAYVAARVAGEEAGHLMRILELSDLRDRHSAILPPDAKVTVGVGWRDVVEDALGRLAGMQVIVPLIREKFGGLDMKVYPRESWRPEDFFAVGPAKAPAKEAALRTCEACGRPGTLRRNGRILTRCDAHVDL